jgi:two-component system, sensor histidine kinase and response regulator
VMDGIAATREIRLNLQFQTLPIIAMTANVMATDREKCIAAGMNDHIAKPIDPEELFTVLLRWIKPTEAVRPGAVDASPAASAAVSEKTPDSDLPEIAGVDTKSALRRTGGNRQRYVALLQKFAQPSQNPIEEIRNALAAGDNSTAARGAHSLKGASANLGASALAEVAAKVEEAINTGKDASPLIQELARSLDAVVGAIRSALPEEQLGSASDAVAADPKSIVKPLAHLKTLLKNDDGEAADYILEARPALARLLTASEITSLGDSVGNFDFAAALKSLSAIAARLAIKLE